MIKHERLILEKLTENPMLSQSELASMLNLTRSSVSVYISNLMRMGYIRGRGYLIEDHSTVAVIGTASIDYRTAIDEQIFADLNRTRFLDNNELCISFGGIGKNVADSIRRIGHNVSYICAVGSDALGRELLDECRQNGVDIGDALIVPAQKSSTYLEISSRERQEILISSANTKLQQSITPAFLQSKTAKLRRARAIIIEDGLSEHSLQYISSNFPAVPVFMICSKPTRVSHFSSFLNQFQGLALSLASAWALLGEIGTPPTQDSIAMDIARQLSKKVDGAVLIGYGSSEVVYANQGAVFFGRYPGSGYRVDAFSHYRDTFASAFFHCLLEDMEGEDLIRYVCACRRIVSSSKEIVNTQLCPELIATTIQNLPVEILTSNFSF